MLGEGTVTKKLTVEAAAVSETAKAKLEAAGCTIVIKTGKPKWTRAASEAAAAAAAAST